MLTKTKARRIARVRRAVRKAGAGRARLSVFRSSKHIYAQVIDDAAGRTLAAASSIEKDLREKLKTGADTAAAAEVGKLLAERAVKAGVKDVVFDRGRLSLSRPGEGPGRRGARRRPQLLVPLAAVGRDNDIGPTDGHMAREPRERDRDRERQRIR